MSKMLFEEFTKNVAEQIKAFLPERFADADVELKIVTKNNDLKLTGLTIKAVDSNIAPTIYLERFYEEYKDGKDMDKILQKIADFRIENDAPAGLDVDQLKDFERIKDKLVPHIISLALNEELLEDRPHRVIEDLAVTYYVVLDRCKDGTAGVAVTHNIMDCWGVSLEDIDRAAVMNLQKSERSELKSLTAVLAGMCGEGFSDILPEDCGMYVLSNEHNLYGAAALLDERMMAHIYEKFDGEFFMIPSSVHEWIVLPKSIGAFDGNNLAAMIREVNATQVSHEDRLSDHAYTYSIEHGLKSAV